MGPKAAISPNHSAHPAPSQARQHVHLCQDLPGGEVLQSGKGLSLQPPQNPKQVQVLIANC